MPSTHPSSTATTPRSSVELIKAGFKVDTNSFYVPTAQTKCSATGKTGFWTAIKRHFKEHHDSVNAVYANTYGWAGAVGARGAQTKTQEVWRYERGVYGRS
jgi:hypothetical protein